MWGPSVGVEIMSEENENGYKIFITRLPIEWTEQHVKEHFEVLFGSIISLSVFNSLNNSKSNNGWIIFANRESQQKALEQKVLHVKKKTIQIREYTENYEDDGICFMWRTYNCVHGDNCKFLHEGEGGCVNISAHGEGKKKCLSFKTKGKCSKGDSCPFLHIAKATIAAETEDQDSTSKPGKSKSGICNSFKKKGKCRKGDNCRYLHQSTDYPGDSNSTNKRKRIDGQTLVEHRKRLMLEETSSL